MDLNNSTTPEVEKDLAQTPPWFVKAAENFLGFRFDLDVATLAATAKCDVFYSLADHGVDSLALPWADHNWCNPPYSNVTPWITKAADEAARSRTSCLLIPNKAEVGYTRLCRQHADTIIHMPFRLNFLRPDGSEFLDGEGRKQGPKSPVMLALFTPQGLRMPVRDIYIDFREYTDIY